MKTRVKNTAELREIITSRLELMKDPGLKEQVEGALQDIEVTPIYLSDKWIYRMVIICLGLVILTAATGATVAFASEPCKEDYKMPVILITITSTAIGALTGLLSPSPKQSNE